MNCMLLCKYINANLQLDILMKSCSLHTFSSVIQVLMKSNLYDWTERLMSFMFFTFNQQFNCEKSESFSHKESMCWTSVITLAYSWFVKKFREEISRNAREGEENGHVKQNYFILYVK